MNSSTPLADSCNTLHPQSHIRYRYFYHHLLSLTLLVVAVVALSLLSVHAAAQCQSQPVIFNFGDSNSDTGGMPAGLGYAINSPNGRVFFRKSTGRLSDGRLLIDFLCQSLNARLLSPYMESLGSNFENGANFAIVGSSTLPKYVPFALNVQIMQFIHFRARSLELLSSGSKGLIDEQGFRNALYMIDIGQNDIADSFSRRNLSYNQVIGRVPLVIAEIRSAVKALYDSGARKFWIHNTGPLGCLPQKLSMVQHNQEDLDSSGCISMYNNAAKSFNRALFHFIEEIKSELTDATVVHVDIYSIKYDLIANATKYGFISPLMACCGSGGPPYNYNIRMVCGTSGFQACEEGSKHVSWDGIHYTEAANSFVAEKVLSMDYSTPRLRFDFFCK